MSNKEDAGEILERMLRREAKTRLDSIEKRLDALEATPHVTEIRHAQHPSLPAYMSPEWYAEYQDRLENKRARRMPPPIRC